MVGMKSSAVSEVDSPPTMRMPGMPGLEWRPHKVCILTFRTGLGVPVSEVNLSPRTLPSKEIRGDTGQLEDREVI